MEDLKTLRDTCARIADQLVPQYRNSSKGYGCTSPIAKRWGLAWDAACLALGANPEDYKTRYCHFKTTGRCVCPPGRGNCQRPTGAPQDIAVARCTGCDWWIPEGQDVDEAFCQHVASMAAEPKDLPFGDGPHALKIRKAGGAYQRHATKNGR